MKINQVMLVLVVIAIIVMIIGVQTTCGFVLIGIALFALFIGFCLYLEEKYSK